MSKLTLVVWTLVLANAVIAYTALNLSMAFDSIFEITIEGGWAAMPVLSKNYISYQGWFCAVFTVPLLLAAVFVSARRKITPEDTLVFGAITLLIITLQISFAATALSRPFIPVLVHGFAP